MKTACIVTIYSTSTVQRLGWYPSVLMLGLRAVQHTNSIWESSSRDEDSSRFIPKVIKSRRLVQYYSGSSGNQPALIMDLLPLDVGDEVWILTNMGELSQPIGYFKNQICRLPLALSSSNDGWCVCCPLLFILNLDRVFAFYMHSWWVNQCIH